MVCIYCGHKTKVTNSRTSVRHCATWRRRECLKCHSIFTSREGPDLENSLRVHKSDSLLEPFYRDRLFISITNSLSHRKTALSDATELTDTIINRLLSLHTNGLLEKLIIRNTVLEVLERFDPVAGAHYDARHNS